MGENFHGDTFYPLQVEHRDWYCACMLEQNKSQEEKEKRRVPTVSAKLKTGALVELVYDGAKTQLCIYADGYIRLTHQIDVGEELLVPLPGSNNLLVHKAVLLPSMPIDYGSLEVLNTEIGDYFYKYVDLTPGMVDVACAYVLLTWVFDAFRELPYLRFVGDFGFEFA